MPNRATKFIRKSIKIKMIYIFNVIPIKVSACFLVEIDKLVLKDICKSKGTRASLVAQRLKHLPAVLET